MSQELNRTINNCSDMGIDLTEVLRILSSEDALSTDLAHRLFSLIDCILRDDLSQIDWDDSWDALDLINPGHKAAIPFLCLMLQDQGKHSNRDQSARVWAIKALLRIGDNSSKVISALIDLTNEKNREIRNEAVVALRKLGHKGLVKRRWI